MSKLMWLLVGLLVSVLVIAVGVMGWFTVASRSEAASRYLSDTRPEGADVYVEIDAQTVNHPWSFSTEKIEVKVGQRVAIGLKNTDKLPHDLVFGAPYSMRTRVLKQGESQWIIFTADKETRGTPFWCTVPGHRQNGMTGVLIVERG